MGQLDHQGLGQSNPDLLDGLDQKGQRGDVFPLLELTLDDGPKVLDGIEIGGISRPIHHREALLLQESHHFFAFMAQCTVLQKVGGLVVLHPEQELLPEHLHVPLPVHGGLGGEEEQGPTAANAGETSPHHHARRMLNVHHHVFLLVAVGLGGPPHLLGPRIHKPEGRLVRKHHFFPVFFRPRPVLAAELQPLSDHPCC